jgi:DNA modification methylase
MAESVDMVLTDPPYGIGFVPQRESRKTILGNKPIANDELAGKDWVQWFLPINKLIYRILKNNSVAYFFSGFNPYYYYYYYSLIESGFTIKANLIWVKNNFGMGYHFRRQYEQCLVGFKGNPPTPETAISDVIFEKKVNSNAIVHSCEKPEMLCKRLITQYTTENNIVIDPFGGSCTTAQACKNLNRKCIIIEIEEKYCQMGVERLKQEVLF